MCSPTTAPISRWESGKSHSDLGGKNQVYEGTVSQVYDYASKGISALGLDEYRVHVKWNSQVTVI